MILHLTRKEKFTKPFISFVKNNFNIKNNFFLLIGGNQDKNFDLEDTNYIKTLNTKYDFFMYFIEFNKKMYLSDKIIIHGLSQPYSIIYLFFNPWLLKKTYWMIWGADLYSYKLSKRTVKWNILEFFKRYIIKHMGYITTTIPGDYLLAKEWYSTDAIYIQNLMYQSHVSRNVKEINKNSHNSINIQVGNCSDKSHNHIEILNILLKYKNENIKIFLPLSYGDENYAKKIIYEGNKLFGDKFIPITDFMSFEKYNDYMSSIDIAIFNYDRQQAMGNIIGLISLGKKVYLKSTITPYKYFLDLGIKVYSLSNDVEINKISKKDASENKEIAKSFFSSNTLKNNWKDILSD
jgi:dTDP-N-acetylfucosamine:lipid II N-acetylfucosaminyltransferase